VNGRDAEFAASLALGLAGDVSRSHKLADDLESRFPEDTAVRFNYLPTLRALFALKRGDPEKAIELLQPAVPYQWAVSPIDFNGFFGGVYPVYVRGEAYLAAGKFPQAAAEFEKIVGPHGILASDPVAPFAQVQLARCNAMAGENAKAQSAYSHVLQWWNAADHGIAIVREAQVEYARVQSGRP
jgi:eukaryotic-like serine/threonine-protein kinase